MAIPCSICTHPRRVEIEAAQLAKVRRLVALEFGVSESSLQRHRAHVTRAGLNGLAANAPGTVHPIGPWIAANPSAAPLPAPGAPQPVSTGQAELGGITPGQGAGLPPGAVEPVPRPGAVPSVNHHLPLSPEEEADAQEIAALKDNRIASRAAIGTGAKYILILNKAAALIEEAFANKQPVDLREVAALAGAAARFSRSAVQNLEAGANMARRRRGDPDLVVKHRVAGSSKTTTSAVELEQRLTRALQMAKLRNRSVDAVLDASASRVDGLPPASGSLVPTAPPQGQQPASPSATPTAQPLLPDPTAKQ